MMRDIGKKLLQTLLPNCRRVDDFLMGLLVATTHMRMLYKDMVPGWSRFVPLSYAQKIRGQEVEIRKRFGIQILQLYGHSYRVRDRLKNRTHIDLSRHPPSHTTSYTLN